ncbi:unnamed protein product, partial [Ectocarpus sp. 6 AP-2014]
LGVFGICRFQTVIKPGVLCFKLDLFRTRSFQTRFKLDLFHTRSFQAGFKLFVRCFRTNAHGSHALQQRGHVKIILGSTVRNARTSGCGMRLP